MNEPDFTPHSPKPIKQIQPKKPARTNKTPGQARPSQAKPSQVYPPYLLPPTSYLLYEASKALYPPTPPLLQLHEEQRKKKGYLKCAGLVSSPHLALTFSLCLLFFRWISKLEAVMSAPGVYSFPGQSLHLTLGMKPYFVSGGRATPGWTCMGWFVVGFMGKYFIRGSKESEG